MSRPRYPVLVCLLADYDCPNDDAFEHRNYYGCVPKNFSERTGRSKTHRQHRVDDPESPIGYRYRWNGGCDSSTQPTAEKEE